MKTNCTCGCRVVHTELARTVVTYFSRRIWRHSRAGERHTRTAAAPLWQRCYAPACGRSFSPTGSQRSWVQWHMLAVTSGCMLPSLCDLRVNRWQVPPSAL